MARSRDVDDYLAGVDDPKRSTLEAVRSTILELLPDAEECISYSIPGYRVGGKMIAGFGAFKNHLTYVPHPSQRDPSSAGALPSSPVVNQPSTAGTRAAAADVTTAAR